VDIQRDCRKLLKRTHSGRQSAWRQDNVAARQKCSRHR
jgi:hypothetical protein